MVARSHIDTDFLVYALATSGPERMRLRALAATHAVLKISAIAWYEFCRGPRTPEQIAVARAVFGDGGIVHFSGVEGLRMEKPEGA